MGKLQPRLAGKQDDARIFALSPDSLIDNDTFAGTISPSLIKQERPGVDTSYHRGLHYFALITTCATFLLIIAGALVTSNDAGLSVPDWPLSHGQLMPEMSGGVFYEHGHRMVAASVGLLTIILNVWLWKAESRLWVRRLGQIALAAVIVQGILGGMTVLFFLPTPVSVVHASLAQLFFCVLVTLSVVTSPLCSNLVRPWDLWEKSESLKGSGMGLAAASAAAIYFQLILGAVLRHSGTVDGSKGAVLVTWTLVAHISGAVLVTTLALLASVAVCRKSAHRGILRLVYLKISLLLLQLALGFSAYLVRVGAAHQVQPTTTGVFFATSHVAVGALLLAVALILALKLAIQKQTWQTSGSVLELQTV